MNNPLQNLNESRRLRYQPFHPDDDQFMFDMNNDPLVLKYTGDNAFKSVQEAREFLSAYQYSEEGLGRWTVIRKEDNRKIGWCGLKKNEEGRIDIGFRFLREEWNKGYATESAAFCTSLGFDGFNLDEIIGRAAEENIASIVVLKKLGMYFEKTSVCHGIENAHYYKLDKTDYSKCAEQIKELWK